MELSTELKILTATDLVALPPDNQRYELVAGLLISEPPASFGHGRVSARIYKILQEFLRPRGLGEVVAFETGFLLARTPDTVRAPDLAFLSKERLRSAGEIRGFFPGPPDIAIEVLSPTDRPGDVHAKVADYLAAGTRLVWVVDPARARVTIHRSLLSPRFLTRKDLLEGEDILPGFVIAVSELFRS